MALTQQQKKRLRGLGHRLRPVVMVGHAGLSQALLAEFDRALEHHELMKVKIQAGDRAARQAFMEALRRHSGAELVQHTGNMGLLFKRRARHSRFATL